MAHNLPLEFVVAERKASDLLNRFGICAPEHIRTVYVNGNETPNSGN
jgi:hypothetical protein